MRTAFVKIWVKDRDLSHAVESVRYERTTEKDDFCRIRFKSDFALNLIDDVDFVANQVVRFQYGFLGQIPSPIHLIKMSEIKIDYKGYIMLEVKCLDSGNVMKKANSDNSWSGLSKNIVKSICNKYGLECSLDENYDYKSYKGLQQAFRSDFELLRYLANKEGNFEVYITSNTLYYNVAKLGKKSVRLFTFGKNIASLSVELKSAHKKRAIGGIVTTTINPNSKGLDAYMTTRSQQIKAEVSYPKIKDKDGLLSAMKDLQSSSDEAIKESKEAEKRFSDIEKLTQQTAATALEQQTKLNGGDYKKAWKELSPEFLEAFGTDDISRFNFARNGKNGKLDRIFAMQKSNNQNPDKSGLENIAEMQKHKKKILSAVLEIELDPSFNLMDIVTLEGVAKRHSGNWYIHQIEDSISGNGPAITKLTLTRNSTNGDAIGGSDKNKKVNNSVGKTEVGQGKKEVMYKRNGVLKNPTIYEQVF